MTLQVVVTNPVRPAFDPTGTLARVQLVDGAGTPTLVAYLAPGQSVVTYVFPGSDVRISELGSEAYIFDPPSPAQS